MQVIYRVVSDGWREALIAGFPPEAITCHQIPDLYAVSSITAFTKPVPRVTPVDWMLIAGTGFGYTRYGTWANDEHSMQKSSWTSGHGMVTLGEYAPLSKKQSDAIAHYRALFNNGGYAIHLMAWNPATKPGANQAAFDAWQYFTADEQPRPGVAGGVLRGTVYRRGGAELELVSIGTGPDRTGLIKSIKADGSWEGSVYTVPFHSAIAVQPIEPGARSFAAGTTTLIPEQKRVLGGSQFEIRFDGTATTDAKLTLIPTYRGLPVESQAVTLAIPAGTESGGKRQHVVIVKVPLPVDQFALQVRCEGGFSATNVEALLQVEQAARPREGVFEGQRAKGGVTFAVLEPL